MNEEKKFKKGPKEENIGTNSFLRFCTSISFYQSWGWGTDGGKKMVKEGDKNK